jgi:hypothetical protein
MYHANQQHNQPQKKKKSLPCTVFIQCPYKLHEMVMVISCLFNGIVYLGKIFMLLRQCGCNNFLTMISNCLLLSSSFMQTRTSMCTHACPRTHTHTHRVTLLPSLWSLLPLWQYWQLQKQHNSSASYMYCSSYPSIPLKPHRSVTSLLMVMFSQLPFCILGRENL